MYFDNPLKDPLIKLGARLGSSIACAVLSLCLFSTAAYAAGTITVNTTTDEFDAGVSVTCSLREAIESANAGSAFGGCIVLPLIGAEPPYDVLVSTPGNYTLTLVGANEDDNATGDLDIRASMNIIGAADVIVEAGATPGSGIDRVFHIVADDLTVGLSDLTIQHGQITDADGASGGALANSSNSIVGVDSSTIVLNEALGVDPNEGGGGLFNDLGGTLIITDSLISENMANVGSGSGGGILNRNGGTLIVTASTIQANSSARAGGGIEDNGSTTLLTDVTLDANETGPTPGNGGGLHLTGAGTVTVTGGTVVSNTASAEGGGLWNSIAGTMTISDVNIVDNVASGAAADQGGGGLFNDGGSLTVFNSTIRNNSADGASGSGGGILNTVGGTLVVSETHILNNSAVRAGGGIEGNNSTTILTNVALAENETGPTPGNGGGLHLTGAGTVTVTGGTVVSNTASAEGGGLWNSLTGTMTLDGVNILGNIASGAAADQGGGGLFNDGGSLAVLNSTISDNVADGTAGSGGGILNTAGGTLYVSNSTIGNNSSVRAGGGIEDNASTTILADVTLAANATGPTPGNGGGLHLTGAGTIAVTGGTVVSNTATAEGGGLWNSITGTMTIEGANIVGNIASGADADQGGGGLFNDGGILNIRASTLANNIADGAAGSGGGILNTAGGELWVHDSVIRGNSAVRAGGGIEDNASTTLLTDVDLIENVTGPTPGNGGGLHATGASTVTVVTALVLSNTASAEGGGLWNSGVGSMTIDKSAFVGNRANGTGANNGGGALFNVGGALSVSNSTLGENSAANNGGGIKVLNGDSILTNITLFDNSADGGVSSIVAVTGTVTLRNSIVGAMGEQDSPLCGGTITIPTNVPNLASDESCGASIVSDPFVGPLQNNGGSTLTYALAPVSQAINAGDNAICAAAPINNVDQRSFTRLQGDTCDLGAFEASDIMSMINIFLSNILNEN